MGEVYRARDARLDRTVAIKILPEHVATNPDLKQRFEREAKALAALNLAEGRRIWSGQASLNVRPVSSVMTSTSSDATPSFATNERHSRRAPSKAAGVRRFRERIACRAASPVVSP